jgi:type II secretory pathway pseudopilin PulG
MSRRVHHAQRGYALLTLIIVLAVLAVMLSTAPLDVTTQSKRNTELDMYYRGEQMAEAIARYYAGGKLSPLGLIIKQAPPYGYLQELAKLKTGVTIGTRQVYFVRSYAVIDPMTNEEWEPVRIGDERIKKFLKAWSEETGRSIPPIYLTYIGSPLIVDTSNPDDEQVSEDDTEGVEQSDGVENAPPKGEAGEEDEEDDEEDLEGPMDGEEEEEDDDDDDDEEVEKVSLLSFSGSSLAALAYQARPSAPAAPQRRRRSAEPQAPVATFDTGGKRPIIGVVSKAKDKAVRTPYGLERYNEILFIYMPPPPPVGGVATNPNERVPVTSPQRPRNDRNGNGIEDDRE